MTKSEFYDIDLNDFKMDQYPRKSSKSKIKMPRKIMKMIENEKIARQHFTANDMVSKATQKVELSANMKAVLKKIARKYKHNVEFKEKVIEQEKIIIVC